MTGERFTEDQADALGEIVNVAMGQAGAALSRLLDAFVKLHSPRVHVLAAEDVPNLVAATVDEPEEASAVTQAFFETVRGESIVLFGAEGSRELAVRLQRQLGDDEQDEAEMLLDTSNIVTGAILSSLGEQLESHFDFAPPSLLGMHRPVADLLSAGTRDWDEALVIDIHFTLEDSAFNCLVVLLMPEASIAAVRGIVDTILEDF